jgi:hypothetical protein
MDILPTCKTSVNIPFILRVSAQQLYLPKLLMVEKEALYPNGNK